MTHNQSYTRTGCGPGRHYYVGDPPAPREDGWTYYTCSACGAAWRTKVISEEVSADHRGDGE